MKLKLIFFFLSGLYTANLYSQSNPRCDSLSLKTNTFYFNNFQDTLNLKHYYSGNITNLEYPLLRIELQDTTVISFINDSAYSTNFPDTFNYKYIFTYKISNIPNNYKILGKYVWECGTLGFTCEYPIFIFLNKTTNIVEVSSFTNKLMPNPFSSSTVFQGNENFLNATLIVFNIYGQEVKQVQNISGKSFSLSREGIPAGIYFINIIQENKPIFKSKISILD